MKTSKLCSVSLILCTALALVACNKAREKDTGTGTGWGQASFSVALVSTGETTATVQESATGDNTAPFYGFVTSDVTSKTEAAIANQLKTVSASWRILKTGTPKPETISGLRRAGIPYRYIVFGLTPDGRTYGTPAEVSFSTTGEYKTGTMSVSYDGRDDEKNLVFTVSGTGEQRYDYAVLTQENAAKYKSDHELLNALMEEANPKDEPIKGDGKVGMKNLPVGKYVIYVYGVEDELVEDVYNPTLQYAKAEFELDRNFDVTYDSWLGNWTVPRGESSDVWVIEAKEEGETYTITGIESNYEWPVTAVYNAEDGSFTIAEQHYINTVNTQQGAASVCLFSLFNHSDGKTYVWGEDNYVFMRADFGIDDTDATFTGLELKDKDGSYGDADGFGFFAVSGEDILGSLLDDDYGASALPNSIKKGGKVPDPDDPGTGEEEVLFEEDFESNISAWTLIDADGDGNEWMLHINEGESNMKTHSGNGLLISESYINNVGPLTPDNWAFTPAIKLSTKNRVSFWITGQDPSYYQEHYGVYIMTEAPTATNIASATKLFEETNSSADFKEHVVEIPAEFDGKTVYIGFRHFNCTDFYVLNLDDVSVKAGEGGGGPAEPEIGSYESWLGEWEVARQSKTDTWTITEKEKGVSYYVQGIDGDNPNIKDVKAVATYKDGALLIECQQNLATLTIEGKEYTLNLFGMYSNSTKIVSGNFVTAEAKQTAKGVATITNGGTTVSIQGDDNEYPVSGMTYFAAPAGGGSGYVFNGQVFYLWPTSMTNDSQGQGGGGDEQASEAYKAWLGDWYLVRNDSEWDSTNKTWVPKGSVTDTWTLSQKVVNKSFTLTGFEALDGAEITVAFESSTGNATITEQNVGDPYTSQGYDVTPKLCGLFYFPGNASNPAGNYIYDENALLCTITPDGKMTPGQAGTYGPMVMMQMMAEFSQGGQSAGFDSWHEEGYALPGTIGRTKPSQTALSSRSGMQSFSLVRADRYKAPVTTYVCKEAVSVSATDKKGAHGRKILPRREGSPARNNQSGLNRNNVQKAERTVQKGQRQYVPTSGTKSGKLN